ncbi:MAG: hypothetical protein RI907_911 [Pseudomonadota bacterium]|jgi:hypothetical protein
MKYFLWPMLLILGALTSVGANAAITYTFTSIFEDYPSPSASPIIRTGTIEATLAEPPRFDTFIPAENLICSGFFADCSDIEFILNAQARGLGDAPYEAIVVSRVDAISRSSNFYYFDAGTFASIGTFHELSGDPTTLSVKVSGLGVIPEPQNGLLFAVGLPMVGLACRNARRARLR